MTNKLDINLIINGKDPSKSKWEDDTTFKDLSEFVVDKLGQDDDISYLFFSSAERQQQYALGKTFKEENMKNGAAIYGFAFQNGVALGPEGIYSITIVMEQKDPTSLDLQTDTTFMEVSDYFVDFYKENSDQVSYNFFNDQKKTQRYDLTKTLNEEKIKNNQTIYGYYDKIKQDEFNKKKREQERKEQEKRDQDKIQREAKIEQERKEQQKRDQDKIQREAKIEYERKEQQKRDQDKIQREAKIEYERKEQQNQDMIRREAKIEQDRIQYEKKKEEEEQEINLNFFMPDGDQSLSLPKNTTFQELSEYFMDENTNQDQNLLGYVFFKDQKKTKKFDLNKTLDQENIYDNSNIYGEEKRNIQVPIVQVINLRVQVYDDCSTTDDPIIDIQQPPQTTLEVLNNFLLNKHKSNHAVISYEFYLDMDHQRLIQHEQRLDQTGLRNGGTLYAKELYSQSKIQIVQNKQILTTIHEPLNSNLNKILENLQEMGIDLAPYDGVTIITQVSKTILSDPILPLWKLNVSEQFAIRFEVPQVQPLPQGQPQSKVQSTQPKQSSVKPVQHVQPEIPQNLRQNQRSFQNQIVSILNEGKTVKYVDVSRLIESTFHQDSAKQMKTDIQNKDFEMNQTFTYQNTNVTFRKDGNGVCIVWQSGKKSKFFILDQ